MGILEACDCRKAHAQRPVQEHGVSGTRILQEYESRVGAAGGANLRRSAALRAESLFLLLPPVQADPSLHPPRPLQQQERPHLRRGPGPGLLHHRAAREAHPEPVAPPLLPHSQLLPAADHPQLSLAHRHRAVRLRHALPPGHRRRH